MRREEFMRLSIVIGAAAVALSLASLPFYAAKAQAAYPEKEIRVIQPYVAGGFNDAMSRKMADVIAKKGLLPKDVLSVAMPGANTRNALQAVLDAAPDGYTLLMHHTALVTTKVSGQVNIGYDDFVMLGGLCAGPIVMDVVTDNKWKSIDEFVADVKANPGKYTMALPGTGGTAHIAMLHYLSLAGIPANSLRYLPLSGGSETMKALLGKKVDIRCATAADAMRAQMGGDTRPLVVLSHQNLPAFKGVPNLKDMGMPNSLHISLGVFAPKGTPKEVCDLWTSVLKEVAADEDFATFADQRGSPAHFLSPEEFRQVYEYDTKLVTDILNKK